MNRKFIMNDITIWVSFVLMLVVKVITICLFMQVHQDTGAEITAVATAYEANDLFKIAMSLNNLGLVISMIILPASGMAFYYYMRRKVTAGKADYDTLTFMVQFVFFSLLINICNDGAALLGKLM